MVAALATLIGDPSRIFRNAVVKTDQVTVEGPGTCTQIATGTLPSAGFGTGSHTLELKLSAVVSDNALKRSAGAAMAGVAIESPVNRAVIRNPSMIRLEFMAFSISVG